MRRLLPLLSLVIGFGTVALWSTPSKAADAPVGPAAVLPADAPGLLPGAREALDATIVAALNQAGLNVLPPERTARFIKDAVDAGLNCSLADDDCALRAGVAAGADAVVLPRAIRLLSLDGTPPRAAAARLDDDALPAGITALAERLRNPSTPQPSTPLPVFVEVIPPDAVITVDGRLLDRRETEQGHIWLVPGTHLLRVSAPGFESTQVVVDVPADSLLPSRRIELARGFPALAGIGLGVAAVGGVILGAGGLGTGIAELLLAQPLDPGLRNTTQTTGRVFIGTAVVGAVALAGGAALAIVGFGE